MLKTKHKTDFHTVSEANGNRNNKKPEVKILCILINQ